MDKTSLICVEENKLDVRSAKPKRGIEQYVRRVLTKDTRNTYINNKESNFFTYWSKNVE